MYYVYSTHVKIYMSVLDRVDRVTVVDVDGVDGVEVVGGAEGPYYSDGASFEQRRRPCARTSTSAR